MSPTTSRDRAVAARAAQLERLHGDLNAFLGDLAHRPELAPPQLRLVESWKEPGR